MKKKLQLLLITLFGLLTFKAQSISPFTTNILSVSDIHENEGLANINIPIANLSIKDYTLDITASYYSKGVKINFESGDIGQNWNLSDKGVITRKISKEADERKVKVTKYPEYGFYNNGSSYLKCWNLSQINDLGLLYNLELVKNNVDKYFNNPNQVDGYVGRTPTKFNYADYNTLMSVDTQSDIFTVVIPGKDTFDFYFDLNGKVQLDSDENYKIEYDLDNYSYFKGFTLTDEQGVKFIFNNMETVKQFSEDNKSFAVLISDAPPKKVGGFNSTDGGVPFCNPNSSSLQYYYDKIPVSWYLSMVENKYGEKINYNYENKKVVSVDLVNPTIDQPYNNYYNFNTHINETPIITSITNSTSSLVYNYEGPRKDFFNFNDYTTIEKLLSISLFYGSEIRRKTVFNSNYVLSNQASTLNLSDVELAVYRRLFLDGISFLDFKNMPIDNYRFEYNNPQQLPHRQSSEKDFWGYYRKNSLMFTYTYTHPLLGQNYTVTNVHGTPKLYTYKSDGLNNIDHNYFSFYKRDNSYTETYPCLENGSILISGPCPYIDLPPLLSDLLIGSLTSIQHQGSKVSFEYDLNYFSYYNIKREGPGSRIKTVKINDGTNDRYTDFIYGDNGNGVGYIDKLTSIGTYHEYTLNGNNTKSVGQATFKGVMDNKISYKIVKSVQRDHNGNSKGSTVNSYSFFDIVNNESVTIDDVTFQTNRKNTYIVTPITNGESDNTKYVTDLKSTPYYIPEIDLKRVNGKLVKRELYDESNKQIETTIWNYQLNSKKVDKIYIFDSYNIQFFHPKGGGVEKFYAFNYMPRKIETTSHLNTGIIKKEIIYKYNPENKISEVTEQLGTSTEKKEIKYMYEGTTVEGGKLKQQNRLDETEVVTLTNDKGGKIKTKNIFNELSFPITPLINNSVIEKIKEEQSLDGTNFYTHREVTRLGINGNVIEEKVNYFTYITTIWGYNQTQPIAKIEGASYNEVMTAFGWDGNNNNSYLELDIVKKSNLDIDETSENSFLTELDLFTSKPELRNYLITTYAYDPLIGLKSVTLPNRIRENYVYDSANRLIKIIDINGRILKENKYNINYVPFKFYNAAITLTLSKNNCPLGQNGTPTTYSIPASKYTSYVSQAEADQQAIAEIQAYANSHGSCSYPYCEFNNQSSSSIINMQYAPFKKVDKVVFAEFNFMVIPNQGVSLSNIQLGNIPSPCWPISTAVGSSSDWRVNIYPGSGQTVLQWIGSGSPSTSTPYKITFSYNVN